MSNEKTDEYFTSLCHMAEQLEEELAEINTVREYCQRCERPVGVCLCPFLPDLIVLKKKIKIWVFQHPYEEKRTLRTTRILEKSLDEKNFVILKGKRFTIARYPDLAEVYSNPNTYVLYPSQTAISLEDFRDLIDNTETEDAQSDTVTDERMFHVILIDGTWAQASGIYYTNYDLHKLKQIKIDPDFTSAYIIRTQPRECFLSTLETVSLILSIIENKPKIHEDLVRPLKALCDFQIQNGSECHQSKEYLILNGLYTKPISKRNIHRLTKNTKLNNNNTDEVINKNNHIEE